MSIPRYADPNYKGFAQFEEDLQKATTTEKEVAGYLKEIYEKRYGKEVNVALNDDYKFDIRLSMDSQEVTVEVKEDFQAGKTGNIAVEYECRGKPSGIAVTKADFIAYKVHYRGRYKIYYIPTQKLKEMIREKLFHRRVTGGDPGSNTKMYLFKAKVFDDNFGKRDIMRYIKEKKEPPTME